MDRITITIATTQADTTMPQGHMTTMVLRIPPMVLTAMAHTLDLMDLLDLLTPIQVDCLLTLTQVIPVLIHPIVPMPQLMLHHIRQPSHLPILPTPFLRPVTYLAVV